MSVVMQAVMMVSASARSLTSLTLARRWMVQISR